MASDETAMKTVHLMYDHEDDDYYPSELTRLSRLSIESSDGEDADAEMSEDDNDNRSSIPANKNNSMNAVEDDDSDYFMMNKGAMSLPGTPVDYFMMNKGAMSLPGTPDRAGPWAKEHASETEARGWARGRRRERERERERWVDRAWEMKRSSSMEQCCRVLVRPGGPDSGPICMDMDEVKACRELGLELPCDWTVEIPCGFSGVDTSSGGNSPIGNWRISSPGDNPRDVKARLKVWAQAVALASASSLSG